MQNFVKNFLIVYETKSRRVEYRSQKFPQFFLRWKAGKHGLRLALICIKKKKKNHWQAWREKAMVYEER